MVVEVWQGTCHCLVMETVLMMMLGWEYSVLTATLDSDNYHCLQCPGQVLMRDEQEEHSDHDDHGQQGEHEDWAGTGGDPDHGAELREEQW